MSQSDEAFQPLKEEDLDKFVAVVVNEDEEDKNDKEAEEYEECLSPSKKNKGKLQSKSKVLLNPHKDLSEEEIKSLILKPNKFDDSYRMPCGCEVYKGSLTKKCTVCKMKEQAMDEHLGSAELCIRIAMFIQRLDDDLVIANCRNNRASTPELLQIINDTKKELASLWSFLSTTAILSHFALVGHDPQQPNY
jgi:hypothetical protein